MSPDDMVRPQQPPRLGIRHVLFPDMQAVAVELDGEIGAIIHDERNTAILRNRFQDPRSPTYRVVVDLLQAQLQASNVAAGERVFELLGKPVRVERGRRDQVEPCRRPRFIVRELAQGGEPNISRSSSFLRKQESRAYQSP